MAGELTDTQRQFLHTMMTNTQRVIALAESMLTDLKLHSSDPLATEPVDIREVVASTAREMRRISDTPIRVDAPRRSPHRPGERADDPTAHLESA